MEFRNIFYLIRAFSLSCGRARNVTNMKIKV